MLAWIGQTGGVQSLRAKSNAFHRRHHEGIPLACTDLEIISRLSLRYSTGIGGVYVGAGMILLGSQESGDTGRQLGDNKAKWQSMAAHFRPIN